MSEAVKLIPFPQEEAHKIAVGARKARKAREIRGSFSIRKLMLWSQAYSILMVEGWSYEEALATSFHLAVLDKTYGSEYTLLMNLYQSVFVNEAKVAVPKERQQDHRAHPLESILIPLVRHCLPLWLHGSNGTGKSYTVERIAAALNRNYIRLQGTGDMTVDDLLGGYAAKNGATYFEYGPLPQAMQQGAVLNIDEISAVRPEVNFELHAVLEGKPLVIKKHRGEVITPKPGFALVVNDNSRGLSESPEFIGLGMVNEAFRDRFLFAEFDHMPARQELEVLKQREAALWQSHGWEAAAPDEVATAAERTPKQKSKKQAKLSQEELVSLAESLRG